MNAGVEMTDGAVAASGSPEPVQAAPVRVGECLRLAREARGDSLADAAQALRIGVRQVEAIERDDWNALPGTPFVRGFVRNYARWLGEDGDALVARIETADLPDSPTLDLRASTTASLPQGHGMPRRDFATLGLALAVIVVAVLAYLFVPDDFWTLPSAMPGQKTAPAVAPAAESTAVAVATPAPAVPPAAASEAATAVANPSPAAASAPGGADGTVPAVAAAAPVPAAAVSEGVAATGAAPTAVPVAAPALAPTIELRFDGRAWAEIRDHQGTLVFSDTVEAGESRAVAGKAPFLVVIGKADAVRLRYKGKTIDLAPHVRRNVARLTLE